MLVRYVIKGSHMDLSDDINKMKKVVERFNEELKKVRTGRAHASMLDGVMVMAYGVQTPLNQVATVSAPESQLLQLSPFDPSNIQAIASAIRDNPSMGLNPTDDGRVIRVPIPPLTEERRREFVKLVGAKLEEAMVFLRNIRHDAFKDIDQSKKDKKIGEDDAKRYEKQIDESMGDAKTQLETAAKLKESEIMKI